MGNKTVSLWKEDKKAADEARAKKRRDSMSRIQSDLGLDEIVEFQEVKPKAKVSKIKKKKIPKTNKKVVSDPGAVGATEPSNTKTDSLDMDFLGDLGLDDIEVFKEVNQQNKTIDFSTKPKKVIKKKEIKAKPVKRDVVLEGFDIISVIGKLEKESIENDVELD